MVAKFLSLILLCLLLPGCVLTRMPYIAPQSGELAYLRVTDIIGRGPIFQQAGVATFEEPEQCQRRRWMQSDLVNSPKGEVTTSFAPIATEKPFSVMIYRRFNGNGPGSYTYCTAVFNFQPEPQRYYLATLLFRPDGCYLSFTSADNAGMDNSRNEQYHKKTYITGSDEEGKFCK